MKKWLKIIVYAIAGMILLGAGVYALYWNPKVNISLSENVQFPLSMEQKLQDFNYLYETLEESFPYFEVKKRQFGIDWLANRKSYEDMIMATSNDLEYFNALKQILNQLQNGHTNVIEPGSFYEELSRLYGYPNPWNQVLNNPIVKKRYEYWKEISEDSSVRCIPVLFRYMEGKYVVTEGFAGGNPEDVNLVSGSVLVSVNGVLAEDYIKDLMSQRILSIDQMRGKPILKYFIIRTNEDTSLELILPDNQKHTATVSPVNYKTASNSQDKPEHLFTAEIFQKDAVAYLKIPSFSSFYVEKDNDGILQFLEDTSHYRSLIIDIRGNGGGSTNYWMNNLIAPLTQNTLKNTNYMMFTNSRYIKPFMKNKMLFGIHTLKPLIDFPLLKEQPAYFPNNNGLYTDSVSRVMPKNFIGFKGHIYLLVDKYVFSSAEAFAVFSKATGWATLVGTDTGGDGIGFDPTVLALPNSGLVVRFPSEMGVTSDGRPNEETATLPDVYAEQLYEDYLIYLNLKNQGKNVNDLENRIQYDTILRTAIELTAED